MRIQPSKKAGNQASVLLVSLVTAAILGAALASYLTMIGTQNNSVARSQAWNSALNYAEAGVEEALAQLNSQDDLSANSWGVSSNGIFGPLNRNLSGGSYSVVIVTNPITTIYATGYVTVPIVGTRISRAVKVTTSTLPLINVAFAALYNIDMNGNGIASDSWNSHDPRLSTNGQYDPTKTSTNGSIASVYGIVDIGNHVINGNLYLGPTASYVSSLGQILGQIFDDYNVEFPDVQNPMTTPLAAPITTLLTTNKNGNVSVSGYVHDFAVAGDYVVNDSYSIYVEPGIKVRVQVNTNNFTPANIHVMGGMTNSGTLMLYQVSGSGNLTGNISVDSNRPENFYYFGMPGVTDVTFGGTTSFIGVIYAPEATLTLNGGGNNIGVVGASITKIIKMNGHYDFHYDESLGTNGPTRGFVPNSWAEL